MNCASMGTSNFAAPCAHAVDRVGTSIATWLDDPEIVEIMLSA
jgi:hypothetical protein